jgi:DnaJ-class molecular chaperone
MIFNPFAVLGLTIKATSEEVEKAFRDRVRTAHPDRGGSSEEFNLLMRAKLQALEECAINESLRIKCATCNDTGKITRVHGAHSLKMTCPDC